MNEPMFDKKALIYWLDRQASLYQEESYRAGHETEDGKRFEKIAHILRAAARDIVTL